MWEKVGEGVGEGGRGCIEGMLGDRGWETLGEGEKEGGRRWEKVGEGV